MDIQYSSPELYKIIKCMTTLFHSFVVKLSLQMVHLDLSLYPPLTVSFALFQPTSARKAPLENPSQHRYGGRLKETSPKIGDYDKRVISKTTLPTTPELFRGLIQAIWQKNYQIWLKKTP